MPRFYYIAKDRNGKSVKGVVEAKDRNIALDLLHQKGMAILSLSEDVIVTKGFVGAAKVPLKEMVMFTRQLATMIDSGIPINQALNILYEQLHHRNFKKIVLAVREDIEAGESLSNALAKHPNAFSPLYIHMVRAGEASGALDEVLDRVALYMEDVDRLTTKVKSAMVYPALVLTVALLITIGLIVFVVPQFKEMFETFGGSLPLPTQILINISNAMRQHGLYFLIGAVILIVLFLRAINSPKGKRVYDAVILKVPVIGDLLTKVAVAKFSRTLATLLRSGVPILEGLEIVAKVSGNTTVEEALLRVKSEIKEGQSISAPLEKTKLFPPMVYRMIGVGEQTGELEKMLNKIASFYEEQVEAAVAALTSLMEPMIMIVLGIVIGGIVISLFLPIFGLSKMIK